MLWRDLLPAGIVYRPQVSGIQTDAHSLRVVTLFYGEPGVGISEPAVWEKNCADEDPALHIR